MFRMNDYAQLQVEKHSEFLVRPTKREVDVFPSLNSLKLIVMFPLINAVSVYRKQIEMCEQTRVV